MALDFRPVAQRFGLEFFGVASLNLNSADAALDKWLDDGYHAGMAFMEKNREVLKDPNRILPGAKNALIFGLPYYDEEDKKSLAPKVALYGQFRDYHRVMSKALSDIASELRLPSETFRVSVDAIPILERAIAVNTSRGFVGKNTCYIDPEMGSFFLLGEILTKIDLTVDLPAQVDPLKHLPQGGCGICNRCQVKCPTGALDEAYRLDARKCLAYWTIENRGPIPIEFWPHLKDYWFGCDLCQIVCPYNKKDTLAVRPKQLSKREFPTLTDIAVMDQSRYEKWFGGTALTRAGRQGLRRNALIALAASRNPELTRVLTALQGDQGFPVDETIKLIPHFLSVFQFTPKPVG